MTMALLVHELAANAAKYGALSIQGGVVSISTKSPPRQWETGRTAKLQGKVVERKFRELVGEVGESDYDANARRA